MDAKKPQQSYDIAVQHVVQSVNLQRILIAITLLAASPVYGQGVDTTGVVVPGYVLDGDTILLVQLQGATITSSPVDLTFRKTRRYTRIEKKVRKIYPYAKAAAEIMAQYDKQLATITDEKERKAFVQEAESEMTRQFESDLRQMTVSEGILLIKLIDRQTGDTSYALIKELKGKFSAFMWQSVARIFGHNLKNEFDAEGDDRIIDDIVMRIESGEIKVIERPVDLQAGG